MWHTWVQVGLLKSKKKKIKNIKWWKNNKFYDVVYDVLRENTPKKRGTISLSTVCHKRFSCLCVCVCLLKLISCTHSIHYRFITFSLFYIINIQDWYGLLHLQRNRVHFSLGGCCFFLYLSSEGSDVENSLFFLFSILINKLLDVWSDVCA